ncbi:MAG: VWA domain-containing protein [Verrucomicrobiales bacterium]
MEVSLIAHKDESLGLLLASLTAAEVAGTPPRSAMQIALVIDRSGSMSGEKLEITKAAVAQFIRSLEPDDRVAIVTYDDHVDLMCGLHAPSEALARRVEALEAGGSTDLYGGWVTGAKIVGRDGRVILLSDGQANAGRYTDAASLSQHAGISYEKYGVTTTTIGVGRDYDEGLMAGMARAGGGAHYFAHTAASITDAFSQERYSAGSVVLERLTVRYNGITEQLGHFWGGETKKRVFQVNVLQGLEFTVRYTDKASGKRITHVVNAPTDFGYSEEAKLEHLLQRASEAEAEMLRVRDPKSATEMKERLRGIILSILAHPSSDESAVASMVGRLKASIDRLESLERNYVEEDAMMHRKRSMQSSHNLRERAKGYSSFDEDTASVRENAMSYAPMGVGLTELRFAPEALALAPIDAWIAWEALPLEVLDQTIVVAMEDPRRGFLITKIERHTGLRVKPVFAGVSSAEIVDIMRRP